MLAVFVVIDVWHYRRDRRIELVGEPRAPVALRLKGLVNIVLIALIVGAILMSAVWKSGVAFDVYGTELALENVLRDGALVVIALVSLWITPEEHRDVNGFSWEPIREVAYLFAGIFVCIVPVLAALGAGENGSLAWLLDVGDAARRQPARHRLFLAHRAPVGRPRQCAHLPGVLRACRRRRGPADGRAWRRRSPPSRWAPCSWARSPISATRPTS